MLVYSRNYLGSTRVPVSPRGNAPLRDPLLILTEPSQVVFAVSSYEGDGFLGMTRVVGCLEEIDI